MQTYRVPAAYAPYLRDVIARAVRTIATDRVFRDDEDEEIRRWTAVPDALIDPVTAGECVLVVGIEAFTCGAGGEVASSPPLGTSAGPDPAPPRTAVA